MTASPDTMPIDRTSTAKTIVENTKFASGPAITVRNRWCSAAAARLSTGGCEPGETWLPCPSVPSASANRT